MNHLLVTDDSLLFFKASREGADGASNLLETYCKASGQKINTQKSSVFFNKGCPQGIIDEIKGILRVQNESLNDKYLGLPSDVGISKNGTFKYLKDGIWKKIQGWMNKLLYFNERSLN